ncbi:hypothetical protein [Parachlamydia sp. AcF125]|uniref:hypothetical protein n=1 Tax=Parachlamydia sp. AcF125 TaxID=2795736 RepID=UPI001BC9B4BF|nr:hypothetical protein [Parachlamydia sp. AcF125]MBS4167549.1 hypothetical protein [Parachlamydia sp. AcF125]
MAFSPIAFSNSTTSSQGFKSVREIQTERNSSQENTDRKIRTVISFHIFPPNIPSLGSNRLVKTFSEKEISCREDASAIAALSPQKEVLQELKEDPTIGPENLQERMVKRGLKDADSQFEVIRYYLEKFPVAMLLKLESFALLSKEQKIELFEIALVHDSSLVSEWRAAFSKSNRQIFSQISTLATVLEKFTEMREEGSTLQEILHPLNRKGEQLFLIPVKSFLGKMLDPFENFLQKKEGIIWLAFAFDRLSQLEFSCSEESSRSLQLIECLSKLDDTLKYPIAALLFDSYYFPLWQGVSLKIDVGSLPVLIFTLFNLGKEKEEWVDKLQPKKRNFILSALLQLGLSMLLNGEQKRAAFRLLFLSSSEQEILAQAAALKGLLAFRDSRAFDGLTTHLPAGQLQAQFLKALQHVSLLAPAQLSFDFLYYYEIFSSWRNPQALIHYAIELNNLSKKEDRVQVLRLLKEFFKDTLRGRFHTKRYDTTLSPHLRKIFYSFPALKESWKENSVQFPLSDSFLEKSLTDTVAGCWVEETDAMEDLLLCTTEVSGSCLSIYGNCEDNKALLAYLLDGKNKLICVKSRDKMIGRAILRLLWDNDNQAPVLFLETFYSSLPYTEGKAGASSPYEQLEKAVIKAAKAKASLLGLPLLKAYSSHDQKHLLYDHAIVSLGGRAPYECCDAIGSIGNDEQCPNSFFSIPQAQIIC